METGPPDTKRQNVNTPVKPSGLFIEIPMTRGYIIHNYIMPALNWTAATSVPWVNVAAEYSYLSAFTILLHITLLLLLILVIAVLCSQANLRLA